MGTILYILLAFVISVCLIPLIILYCNKHSIFDSHNERKIHTGNISRFGGIAIVTAFIIPSCIYIALNSPDCFLKFLPMIIAGVVIFAFGIVDDIIDMGGIAKFIIQSIAAILLIFNGYQFTNFFGWETKIVGAIVTYCWIIGMINAYNLIDGYDGLCGGLSFFVTLTYGLFEFTDCTPLSVLSCILAASILGFLIYNKPKAKIFMGDGGAQFLGFILAVFPLYNTQTTYENSKLLIIALLSMIPLLDVVAAMWRRTREHHSFFAADKSHIHHKLMNLGYGSLAILTILYGLQLFLCADVIVSQHVRGKSRYMILALGYIVVISFFCIIHYTNRAVILKHKKDQEQIESNQITSNTENDN